MNGIFQTSIRSLRIITGRLRTLLKRPKEHIIGLNILPPLRQRNPSLAILPKITPQTILIRWWRNKVSLAQVNLIAIAEGSRSVYFCGGQLIIFVGREWSKSDGLNTLIIRGNGSILGTSIAFCWRMCLVGFWRLGSGPVALCFSLFGSMGSLGF